MEELRAKSPEELNLILEELVLQVYPILKEKLKKIVLFGSYARGDYDAESDIDVMIMVNADERELKKYGTSLSDIILTLDLKYDVLIAEIVQSYHQFIRYLDVLPFYQNIQNEGIVFYEQ